VPAEINTRRIAFIQNALSLLGATSANHAGAA